MTSQFLAGNDLPPARRAPETAEEKEHSSLRKNLREELSNYPEIKGSSGILDEVYGRDPDEGGMPDAAYKNPKMLAAAYYVIYTLNIGNLMPSRDRQIMRRNAMAYMKDVMNKLVTRQSNPTDPSSQKLTEADLDKIVNNTLGSRSLSGNKLAEAKVARKVEVFQYVLSIANYRSRLEFSSSLLT